MKLELCCNKCGGFKGEPGKSYGYAGRWCRCEWTEKLTQPTTQKSLEERIAELEESVRRLQQTTAPLVRLG